MKKVFFKIINVCAILVMLMSVSAYAKEDTMLLPRNVKVSKAIIAGAQRSSTFAMALSDITNEGKGAIGVRAESNMHKNVSWAKLTTDLQRRETEGATTGWITELTLTEEAEDVHEIVIDEVIYGQPSGYYYRVKTFHEIESEENGYEDKTTYTNGVMITKY